MARSIWVPAGMLQPPATLPPSQLPPTGAPPTRLALSVPPEALLTFAADGSRSRTGGVYQLAVSGHLPDDAEGTQGGSNVLLANVTLGPAPPPLPYALRRVVA